ncbi:MAG: ABC transporter substrate-binding protein, partial [Desulfurococcaceae archaeon]
MSTSKTKVPLYIAITILVIGILIGLGLGYLIIRPEREVTPTPEKITIRVSMGWTGKEREPFDAAINEYIRRNPNVEIVYLVYRAEDIATLLPPQLEAGTTMAEIFVTPWSWFVVELGKRGHLLDLSDYISMNEFLKDYLDLVTYDNKLYGVPIGLYFKELYWYRKSFFQVNGLSEPRTWDEFIALLDTLRNTLGSKKPIIVGDGLGWPASDIVESFILAFGGAELHSGLTKGTINFNDPQVQSIFRDKLVPLIKA